MAKSATAWLKINPRFVATAKSTISRQRLRLYSLYFVAFWLVAGNCDGRGWLPRWRHHRARHRTFDFTLRGTSSGYFGSGCADAGAGE